MTGTSFLEIFFSPIEKISEKKRDSDGNKHLSERKENPTYAVIVGGCSERKVQLFNNSF